MKRCLVVPLVGLAISTKKGRATEVFEARTTHCEAARTMKEIGFLPNLP